MSGSERMIVIGAASGIGRATAQLAVERGYRVAMIDVNREVVESAERLGQRGLVCDVADEAELSRTIAEASAWLGESPDSLVIAAGIFGVQPAVTLTASTFRQLLDINLTGCFVAARETALSWLADGRGGSIVILSSTAGWLGDTRDPGAHYSASKGALIALTKQLSIEWAAHGIRVNCVAPGIIQTPMLGMADDDPVLKKIVDGSVPLARTGTADEVASCCLFLAGPASSYVTGAVLAVDGGLSAQ